MAIRDATGFGRESIEGIFPAARRIAFRRQQLRANLHEVDWAEEQISGISYRWVPPKACRRIRNDWPSLKAAMGRIRTLLVNRAGMLCNVTIDATSWRPFEPELASLLLCRHLGCAVSMAGRRRTELRGA